MKITIYEDRSYSKDYLQNEGTEFENKATTLLFNLPEVIEGYNISELNKYIVFDIDGEQNKDILTAENTYILPNSITELGKVKFNLYLVETIPNLSNDFIFSTHICSIELASNKTVSESAFKSKHNSSCSISASLCIPISSLVENVFP